MSEDQPDLSWWTADDVDCAVSDELRRQLDLIDALTPARQQKLNLQRLIRCSNCRTVVIKVANLRLPDGTDVQIIRFRPPHNFDLGPEVARDDPRAMARAMAERKTSYRREGWTTTAPHIAGRPATGRVAAACNCSTYGDVSTARILSGEITSLGDRRT